MDDYSQDIAGRIMAHAFNDELEKISSLTDVALAAAFVDPSDVKEGFKALKELAMKRPLIAAGVGAGTAAAAYGINRLHKADTQRRVEKELRRRGIN